MKIFVTGATGFIGKNLIPRLITEGYQVTAFVLPNDHHANILELGDVKVREGDIRNPISIYDALKDCEAVIHLAAVQESNDPEINEAVNFKGVKNIIDVCMEKKCRRLIHLSSIATCYQEKNYYGIAKEKGDKLVQDSGLDYTILRPTLVYGRDCHQGPFHTFLGLVNKLPGVVPLVGNGKALKQPVHVDDVVSAILLALKSTKSIGKYYDVSGGDVIPVEEMVSLILEQSHEKKIVLKIPTGLLYPVACALEKINKNPFFTRESLTSATQDAKLSHAQIKNELGYKPVSFREGLIKTFSSV